MHVIKKLRKEKHMSQDQLAEIMGVVQSKISLIESRDVSHLTGKQLIKLCEAFEVSSDFILGIKEND